MDTGSGQIAGVVGQICVLVHVYEFPVGRFAQVMDFLAFDIFDYVVLLFG